MYIYYKFFVYIISFFVYCKIELKVVLPKWNLPKKITIETDTNVKESVESKLKFFSFDYIKVFLI